MLEETGTDVTTEQILAGCLPWDDPPNNTDDRFQLPLRAKRKSVEVYLTGKRLAEEILLLEEEMRRFLCYYKDNVIPDLWSRLQFLEKDELPNDDNEDTAEKLEEGKYRARQFSRMAMAGETALLKSGIFFCKRMIKEAVNLFKRVVEGKIDELELFDSENEDEDEDEDEDEEREGDSEQEQEDDVDS